MAMSELEKTMDTAPRLICSICHEPIVPELLTGWSGGHNAEPINDGRCCSTCNSHVVVPERLRRLSERRKA